MISEGKIGPNTKAQVGRKAGHKFATCAFLPGRAGHKWALVPSLAPLLVPCFFSLFLYTYMKKGTSKKEIGGQPQKTKNRAKSPQKPPKSKNTERVGKKASLVPFAHSQAHALDVGEATGYLWGTRKQEGLRWKLKRMFRSLRGACPESKNGRNIRSTRWTWATASLWLAKHQAAVTQKLPAPLGCGGAGKSQNAGLFAGRNPAAFVSGAQSKSVILGAGQ